jgi:excisionase family DNA binding protein
MLTLATAAEQAGTAKSTIFRWIKAGRLSATRADDGTFRIDPSELQRVLESIAKPVPEKHAVEQAATESTVASGSDVAKLRETLARMEAELDGLKALIEAERRRAETAEKDRDRWAAQAERLALPAPAAPTVPRPGLLQRLFRSG